MAHLRNGETHVNETEASGGSKEGVVRWVLLISMVLAIGFLSIIWMTGALTQGDVEEEATVSGEIQSMEDTEGTSTDSIVTDQAPTASADAPTPQNADTAVTNELSPN